MKPRFGTWVVGAATIALLSAAASPAGAAVPTSAAYANAGSRTAANLVTLQQKGEAAIDKRLATIADLQTKVAAAKYLTGGHKAALTTLLGNDSSGLTTLRAQIAADTTMDALKPHLLSITHDYRIYLVVEPQVHVSRAADGVSSAAGKLNDVATKLDGVVVKLKAAGKDTTAVEAQLATAHSEAAAAGLVVTGQADAVEALTPSAYPSNKATLDTARADVKSGATHVKAALGALKQARSTLKALAGNKGGTVGGK